jgi:hypothetical protein
MQLPSGGSYNALTRRPLPRFAKIFPNSLKISPPRFDTPRNRTRFPMHRQCGFGRAAGEHGLRAVVKRCRPRRRFSNKLRRRVTGTARSQACWASSSSKGLTGRKAGAQSQGPCPPQGGCGSRVAEGMLPVKTLPSGKAVTTARWNFVRGLPWRERLPRNRQVLANDSRRGTTT